MKKLCGLLLTALVLLSACQKETSLENGAGLSAEGSLQSDLSGDCLPKNVLGIYEAGTALVPTANMIEVQVDVLKTGPFLIVTDTVNGYYFRATGNFTATGINTVTLQGGGEPLEAGINNFRVIFDSTECIIPVSVLPEGGAVPAVMTFDGSPGVCVDYSVGGEYVVGVPLDISNIIGIKVNVQTAGTYSIISQTSNGMTFTASGTILEGEQIITLTGSGTPATAGSTDVPVSYNSTTNCAFTIEVLSVAEPNYFPRKPGSNWSYDVDDNVDSILFRSKTGANSNIISNGNVFNIFEAKAVNLGDDFVDYYAFSKKGAEYYAIDDIGYLLDFDPVGQTQLGEFMFLNHNANVGTSWYSPVFDGTMNGTPVRARIKFTILEKNVTTSLETSEGNFDHPNTIVVEEQNELEQNGNWVEYGYFYKNYFALDVGKVKVEGFNANTPTIVGYKEELRRYQIVQ